ncbi:hypothetical protein [Pseudomonas syringae pv. coryli]|uniref:hypothetical protein n=1 Tax=Pseudomonas syringae pv. coryli TaxID=317659 RepID=UPI003D2A336B
MIRPIWFVAPFLTAIGALFGAYQASQDIDPATYVGLSEAWPRLSPEMRAQVRAAMSDGALSNWEYRGLSAAIMDSAGYMRWSIDDNNNTVEKARSNLITLIQQEP